ncbi:aldehyde dehydrogenase family protein [Cochlodiniinecator piscidefendens]|uniref:aldehyde dehydrogenase family protein n=1 Tax=Cochlodiniinecator piscidefendens TaxID=2715756 RepID=UPI0014087057|nr:aldehyde dehydrogenase family protein [Cochlodiniinecator piscidefendens]
MVLAVRYPEQLGTIPHAFINGAGCSGVGAVRPLTDPATGRVFLETNESSPEQAQNAVQAAKAALPAWSDTAPGKRADVLFRLAGLIEAQADELAVVEALNVGKPLSQAKRDVGRAADYFRFYAGCCDKLNGDTIPLGPDKTALTVMEPVGVTVHILPWNYPISTLARGVAPALAAGATVVAKPSELTPLSAIMVAQLAIEAGLLDGVLNVVCGAGSVGETLCTHPDTAHVTFTGSTQTGRSVMQSASAPIAGVTLELGGKSPVVVLADADLDAAADGIAKGIFFNAGQVCAAGARLICDRSVHDDLLEKLIQAAQKLTIGHPLDDPDLGPLVSSDQLSRVEGFVVRAKEAGFRCVTGGQRARPKGLEGGLFYEPTIFADVPANSEIAQSEIFGPVLITQLCDTFDEALTLSNNSPFGLVAGIYTANVTKAMRYARQVEAGQVFINGFLQGGDTVPFGGVKQSGIGREKGLAGLAAYTVEKSIVLNHAEGQL